VPCTPLLLPAAHLVSPPRSGFSPLEGFMNQAEYDSVVANMRTTVSDRPRPGGGREHLETRETSRTKGKGSS
jgi:hypothetical protein